MALRTTRDHQENSPEGRAASERAKSDDKSTAEVQAQVDEDNRRGYRGVEVDPTDNAAYSVAGVTSGEPTPETDEGARERAEKAQREASRRAAGVAER